MIATAPAHNPTKSGKFAVGQLACAVIEDIDTAVGRLITKHSVLLFVWLIVT
jgi:hypothetical protein